MIHPHTELRTVSPEVGVGVFATQLIPKGSIVYISDPLEIIIPAGHSMLENPIYKQIIDRYAVVNANGSYEISWDNAKFVNHCCHYNTICTSFGVDIAIRDIQPGEQILEDYGLFNVSYAMDLICTFEDCRHKIALTDFDQLQDTWDADAREALAFVGSAPQPLWDAMQIETREKITQYLATGEGYISISAQHRIS